MIVRLIHAAIPIILVSVLSCAHIRGKDAPDESCVPGTVEKCLNGQVCMNTMHGSSCLAIPSPARSLELALPFDDAGEVVCTHASGTGTHSWPNAFYAVDLATPYDRPPSVVRASADGLAFVFLGDQGKPCRQPRGTPAKAEWDQCGEGWGNSIKVLHSDGYFTFYVHLEKALITSGARVRKGQPIGIEGWTGAAGHRHLHWSVQRIPGANAQEWKANLLKESGFSVPFTFEAFMNGKSEKVSVPALDCAHANIGQVPAEKQPRFRGLPTPAHFR